MEYEEKLFGNLKILFKDNHVKVIEVYDKDKTKIIANSLSNNKFKEELKKCLLIQFKEYINNEKNEYRIKRLNKLIDNIDEVVDILLVKISISIADKTNLFKNIKNTNINSDDLRVKKISQEIFKTELNFPLIEEIEYKARLLNSIESSYVNHKISSNIYNEKIIRYQQELDLMFCTRGELGDQFNNYYLVKLSGDVIDDYEARQNHFKSTSKSKKKRRFLRKQNT